MDITKQQICDSNLPYHMMFVASETTPGMLYTITVVDAEDGTEDWICSCPSWKYRGGHCKHVATVAPCRWTADEGPESQTDDQKRDTVCPRCGGPTSEEWVIE